MSYGNYYEHTFHNAASAAGNGNVLKVNGKGTTLRVETYGSVANTARTLTFYRKSRNGTLVPITGVRTSDFSTGTSTTGTGEEWDFDITNAYEIVMDLTSITGGTFTVIGRLS